MDISAIRILQEDLQMNDTSTLQPTKESNNENITANRSIYTLPHISIKVPLPLPPNATTTIHHLTAAEAFSDDNKTGQIRPLKMSWADTLQRQFLQSPGQVGDALVLDVDGQVYSKMKELESGAFTPAERNSW